MDATGVGDPIYDDLARVWPRIEPVKFTNLVKVQLVQRLVVAIEQRQISWPDSRSSQFPNTPSPHWSILTDELKRYEYSIGASGAITYSAPSGFHDDCVMALALAVAGRQNAAHVGSMVSFASKRISSTIQLHSPSLR